MRQGSTRQRSRFRTPRRLSAALPQLTIRLPIRTSEANSPPFIPWLAQQQRVYFSPDAPRVARMRTTGCARQEHCAHLRYRGRYRVPNTGSELAARICPYVTFPQSSNCRHHPRHHQPVHNDCRQDECTAIRSEAPITSTGSSSAFDWEVGAVLSLNLPEPTPPPQRGDRRFAGADTE